MAFPILKDCSKTVFLNNGKIAVKRFQIIGTSLIIYNTYKKDNTNIFNSAYCSITFIDNQKYGMIGTKILKCKKPVGEKRFKIVSKWQTKQYNFAHNCILKAFPELNNLKYEKFHSEISRTAQKGIDF